MSTDAFEHRKHRRVEFFLVHEERDHVPVWVFKPSDAVGATAALVTNFSESGLQVLTASDGRLDHASYEIQLLLGEDDDVARFRGRASRMWTREAFGAGWLSGFRFEAQHSSAEDFIRTYLGSIRKHRWVRCVLV